MWRWEAFGGSTETKARGSINRANNGSDSAGVSYNSRPRKRRRYSTATHFSISRAESDLIQGNDQFGETIEGLELPSDTLAALKVLRSEFPIYSGVSDIPVILEHHVLSMIEDRTQVNQELDLLFGEHVLRRTYLSTGKEDFLLVFCDDYKRLILKHAKEDKAPVVQTVLYIFEQVLRYIPTMYITAHEIIELYTSFLSCWKHFRLESAAEANRRVDSGGIGKNTSLDVVVVKELERLLLETGLDPKQAPTILLSSGFLIEKQLEGGKKKAYCLVVPYIGQYLKHLLSGRKKAMRAVKARQFKEILETDLRKVSFKENFFNNNFFVRDLLGSDKVYVLKTSSGRLIRLH